MTRQHQGQPLFRYPEQYCPSLHLVGFKGERDQRYGVLWIFENEAAITANFGTPKNPKWPDDWLHYENDILAKYLDRHPDTVDFTDYAILSQVYFG